MGVLFLFFAYLFSSGIIGLLSGHELRKRFSFSPFILSFFNILFMVFLWDRGGVAPGELIFRGWIGKTLEDGALQIGFFLDPTSLILLSGAIFLTALINTGMFFSGNSRSQWSHAPFTLQLALLGLSVSWFSLTPWMNLIGIGISGTAGLFSVNSGNSGSYEVRARALFRLLRQMTIGMIVSVMGLAILATHGIGFRWDESPNVSEDLSVSIGMILIFLGGLGAVGAFPFGSKLKMEWKLARFDRLLIAKVFMLVSAQALLFRLVPAVSEQGFFHYGLAFILTLGCANAVIGIFQKQKEWALDHFIYCVFLLGIFIVSTGGIVENLITATSLLVGGVFFTVSSMFAGRMGEGSTEASLRRAPLAQRLQPWIFSGTMIGVLIGIPGFSRGWAMTEALQHVFNDPIVFSGAFVGIFFEMILAAYLLLMLMPEFKEPGSIATRIVVIVLALSSLSIVWIGSLGGGVLPPDLDLQISFGVKRLFGEINGKDFDGQFPIFYYGGALVAGLIGFFLMKKTAQSENEIQHSASLAMQNGLYLSDFLHRVALLSAQKVALINEYIFEQKVRGVLMQSTGKALRGGSERVQALHHSIEEALILNTKELFAFIAKAARATQAGGVQGYFFYSLAILFAILLFFEFVGFPT